MAKLLELRQRIKAVENIQAVTRTLATVAAAKLSRTRRRAAGMRAYARSVRDMFHHQQAYLAHAGLRHAALASLLEQRQPVKNIVLLVITADRGMCGGYNLEAMHAGLAFWERSKRAGQKVSFIVKGRRGVGYFKRRRAEIVHHEGWWREGARAQDVERLLSLVLNLYRSGAADAVWAIYTEFYSPIHRRARAVRLLPVEVVAEGDTAAADAPIEKWHHEPAFTELLDELLAVHLRVRLYDLLLESYASEQGARMITMQEASERADKTLQEYRVLHHRLRREAITLDLLQTLFASKAAEEA